MDLREFVDKLPDDSFNSLFSACLDRAKRGKIEKILGVFVEVVSDKLKESGIREIAAKVLKNMGK